MLLRPTLPRFWVGLHQAVPGVEVLPGRLPEGSNLRVDQAVSLFRLALSAKGIPHKVLDERDRISIYVPPLLNRLARAEVLASLNENRLKNVVLPSPPHENALAVILFLLLLALWHGICRNVMPLFPQFGPSDWIAMGAADAFRMAQGGQWYRSLTALTLHADSLHVFGNILFGSCFIVLLCRRTGLGQGFFLVILSGALGNMLNALLQPAQHVSIGFSTSVFGAVGSLCGIYGANAQRGRLWVVLGAGLALLALLGSEGVRTDIVAHLFGLICGFAAGMIAGALLRMRPGWFEGSGSSRLSGLLGLVSASAVAGAWCYALRLRFLAM